MVLTLTTKLKGTTDFKSSPILDSLKIKNILSNNKKNSSLHPQLPPLFEPVSNFFFSEQLYYPT